MSYRPSVVEIANLRARFLNAGRAISDRQARDYLIQNYNVADSSSVIEQSGVVQEDPVPWGVEAEVKSIEKQGYFPWAIESATDMFGATLWSALDTATIGLAGLAVKNVSEDAYNWLNTELYDTTMGMVGGTVGSLGGFMVPMGWVGGTTSLAVKGARSVNQARKITQAGKNLQGAKKVAEQLKVGKNILKPTTGTLQQTAGLEIARTTGLSTTRSTQLAKNLTDDIVGFNNKGKGFLSRISNSRPAYEMERGAEMVAKSKEVLKTTLPSRLNASLAKEGIKLSSKEVMKLSDDIVEIVAKKPFNTIESIFAQQWGGQIGQATMKIIGAFAQEAVNFGIVGTAMDYVGHLKGEVDLDKKGLFERGMHHLFMGGIFGGVRYVPGGRGRKIWSDLKLRTGRHTANQIKHINKMDDNQLAALARFEMKNNNFTATTTKGAHISRKNLIEKYPFGNVTKKADVKAEFSNLRNSLIAFEKQKFETFKSSSWMMDGAKDILGSLPRMTIGAWAFNAAAIQEGAFSNMPIGHSLFHVGIGAIMTKKGRALFEGKSKKFMGMEFGEKPYVYEGKGEKYVESARDYVYDGDLRDILIGFENSGIATKHIKDLANEYSAFNMTARGLEKVDSKDMQKIIRILEDKEIILPSDKMISEMSVGDISPGLQLDARLHELIAPIFSNIQYRGYQINTKAGKKVSKEAIDAISKIKSEVLGDADSPVYLNSPTQIHRSNIEYSLPYWKGMKGDLIKKFESIVNILGGEGSFSKVEGQIPTIPDFTYNARLLKDHRANSVFTEVRDYLVREGKIKIREQNIGGVSGFKLDSDVKLFKEKFDKVEKIVDGWETQWGNELYASTGSKLSMRDPLIWEQFNAVTYHESVFKATKILSGKTPEGIDPVASQKAIKLFEEVFVRHNNNSDISSMVERPGDLIINTDNLAKFIETSPEILGEIRILERFKSDIHAIAAANGRTPSTSVAKGKKVEISFGKLKELHDEMNAMGMPNYLQLGNDTRIQTWVQKAVNHGLENMIGGIQLSRVNSIALETLVLNGLILTSKNNGNPVLEMAPKRAITAASIKSKYPEITLEQAKSIENSYKALVDNLTELKSLDGAYNPVRIIDNMTLDKLTIDQLMVVERAGANYDLNKISKDLVNLSESIILNAEKTDRAIKTLEETKITMENNEGTNPSELKLTKEALEIAKLKREYIDNNYKDLYDDLRLGVTSSYASSIVQSHKTLKHKDSKKSIFELYKELTDNVTTEKEFVSITRQIDELNRSILASVHENPEVSNKWTTRQIELMNKNKANEPVEGRMDTFKPDFSVERFILDNDIKLENIESVTGGEKLSNATEGFKKIYTQTVKVPESDPRFPVQVKDFVSKIFKLVGTDSKGANLKMEQKRSMSKLRDDVQTLSVLMERSFNSKTLTIQGEGGTYKNSLSSKGFLTDMWVDVFGSTDLIFINSNYISSNGKVRNVWGDGIHEMQRILDNTDFRAGMSETSAKAIQYGKSGGTSTSNNNIDINNITYPINEFKMIEGKHTIVRIDENVSFLIPHKKFNNIAKKFIEWYDIQTDRNTDAGKYTNSMIKNKKTDAAPLFARLKKLKKELEESYMAVEYVDGHGNMRSRMEYNIDYFSGNIGGQTTLEQNHYIHSRIHEMFNVMYGEKVNKNWLGDGLVAGSQYKEFKYRRLPYNLGYTRNSDTKRRLAHTVYADAKNPYTRQLIKTYKDLEFENVVVIDDAATTAPGKNPTNYITDVRSQALHDLELRKSEMSTEQYESTKKILTQANSLNAEQVNGMTAVRRDMLDYRLLIDGKRELIGKSPGQKDVGITSFVDNNGVRHTFYNKTHYFYDSRLETFFVNNPNIHQVAFTSGAKKHSQIDANGRNLFIPIGSKGSAHSIPRVTEGKSLTEFINGLKFDASGTGEGIFQQKFNQTLSGTKYKESKEARIMKQFDNWSSKEVQNDVYMWSRQDVVNKFADVVVPLMDPRNTSMASKEAKKMLMTEGEQGTISSETPNMSGIALAIEADAVPFTAYTKATYDAFIQKKHIDNAGVFDGFTSSGANPILRGNLDGNLSIPIFKEVPYKNKADKGKFYHIQTHLGEANVSESLLNRPIYFASQYGKAAVSGNFRKQMSKNNAADVVISINIKSGKGNETRDVLFNIKDGKIYDPLGVFKDIKKMPKKYTKILDAIKTEINMTRENPLNKEIREVEWLDIQKFLMDSKDPLLKNTHLVVGGMPAPRTGPHDHLVVKVSKKGLLNKADGDIMELNTYDVTMRGQRDFDTDKLPFYMDTPFSALKESMATNALLKEALPVETIAAKELDIYSYESWNTHLDNINQYKKIRGSTIKVHRKLTYLKRIFADTDGLELTIEGKKYKINFQEGLNLAEAQQKLTSDSQAVLDIYAELAKTFQKDGEVNIKEWERDIIFNNKNSFIKMKDSEGKIHDLPRGYRILIEKIADDFGRLLTIESGIWEAGESKAPRYKDMVRMYKDFTDTYRKDRIDWETYHFMAKKDPGQALDMFFRGDPKRLELKQIDHIMINIAESIDKGPVNFLKSLKGVAEKDLLNVQNVRPKEAKSPSGGSLKQSFDKLLGEGRAEVLQRLIHGKDKTDVQGEIRKVIIDKMDADSKGNIVTYMDEAWAAFKLGKDFEGMLTQANHIELDIMRSEKMISKEKKNFKVDNDYIEHQVENIRIKSAALNEMLSRLNILSIKEGTDLFQQKIRTRSYYPNNTVNPPKYGTLKVVNARGNTVTELTSTSEPYQLRKGDSVIENPITLKAGGTHEVVDAIATAYTVNGIKAKITTNDVSDFFRIVKETKKNMREELSSMFEKDLYRDWDAYGNNLRKHIDTGIERIINLAKKDFEGDLVGQFGLPKEKQSYTLDFMMSLLGPDPTANPNEFYFLPHSSALVSATNKNNAQIMKAVFKHIDDYQMYADNPKFMKDFFSTHRGFYDALVGERSFNSGITRLQNSTFEGALLHHTIGSKMNQPFRRAKEYVRLGEELRSLETINSTYAEYFRLIIEEGALVDPYTAAKVRESFLNDPKLGEEAYRNMFMLSRGDVVFGGLGTSLGTYDIKNPGVLIGNQLKSVSTTPRGYVHGKVYASEAKNTIGNHVETIIGMKNSKQTETDTGVSCGN